ncbi:hypothetical protein ACFFKC_09925 [Pseudoduganella danionis]|uniref:Uncharacterized protein n=1 Tax=Pseudoduganella danionis TaxID=1890295 RepID=A0ABW9SKF7_9BURK|nr:hypothetical protein [Pseudoduganella danionis]MTW32658.1 hypothetical protein [Pseudoduganella danionis]
MKSYIYFGLEHHQKAPELFGVLTTSPELNWVGLDHLVSALDAGESIQIRPASNAERVRADATIALYEVGALLAGKLESLLDAPGTESESAEGAKQ